MRAGINFARSALCKSGVHAARNQFVNERMIALMNHFRPRPEYFGGVAKEPYRPMDAGFADLVCFPSLVTLDRPADRSGATDISARRTRAPESRRPGQRGARPGKALEPQVVLAKYLVRPGSGAGGGRKKAQWTDRPDNGNHADRYHAGNQ